jgi:hypothetical protein
MGVVTSITQGDTASFILLLKCGSIEYGTTTSVFNVHNGRLNDMFSCMCELLTYALYVFSVLLQFGAECLYVLFETCVVLL